MIVVMNNKGKYAIIGKKHTHTGFKNTLSWGDLVSATLIRRVSKVDHEGIYKELSEGIQIEASVTRIVTLYRNRETNVPEGAEYYYNNTYYRLGNIFAMYYSNGWKESATSNETIKAMGVPVKC